MEEILGKLKLIDSVTIELPIGRTEFIDLLRNNIDEMQSDFFDVFSSGKNEYKGEVTTEGFELKKKRRLFEMNINTPKAVGAFEEHGSVLVINVEINAFQTQAKLLLVSLVLFYSIFISVCLFGGDEFPSLLLPFILLHASFMIGVPYFLIKRSVKRMKYDLERDLYYLATKKRAVSV